jgi:uncharacterized RDD family membrane protein YckC
MQSNETNESGQPQSRYVWDREKLVWVESGDRAEPSGAEPESALVEPLEATAEEVGAIALEVEEEGPQLRGAFIRVVAFSLDFLVVLLAVSVVQIIFGSESAVSRFIVPLMGFVYFVGLWTLRGQTMGKIVVGAQVVRLDGSPVGFVRSVVRYLVYIAYFYALALSAVHVSLFLTLPIVIIIVGFVALSRYKRGLHDLAAGTMVINSRPALMEDYIEEVWEAPEEESEVFVADEDED